MRRPMLSHPRLSAWAQPVLAALFGLGLLAAGELTLRAGGWMTPTPPLSPDDPAARLADPGDAIYLEPTAQDGAPALRTARAQVRDRRMADVTAPLSSPHFRVILLGGSAALGVPIEADQGRTIAGRLAARLATTGQPVDVLNFAGASFSSDQAVSIARQSTALAPDVFVVWAGNNELFADGMRLTQANQTRAASHVHRLHLVRGLRTLLGRPLPDPAQALATLGAQGVALQQRATLARLHADSLEAEGPDAWPSPPTHHRRDAAWIRAHARYSANLERLAQISRDVGAQLLIAPLPANLDEPPWLALHRPNLDPASAAAWDAAVLQARDSADPVAAWTDAINIDPMHAQPWFERGQARRGSSAAHAIEDLQTALALDYDAGRPLPGFDAAVRALATLHGHVRAVEPGHAFAADAPVSPWHDSCHLTPAAQDAVAARFADAIRPNLPDPGTPAQP